MHDGTRQHDTRSFLAYRYSSVGLYVDTSTRAETWSALVHISL